MRLAAVLDGRRTGLLQADDVAAEAEAKVARMRAGNLLRRLVDLAVVDAG